MADSEYFTVVDNTAVTRFYEFDSDGVFNQLLQIGEEIDGMRLILIDEGRAIFRHQGKNYEITLDEPSAEAQAESEE